MARTGSRIAGPFLAVAAAASTVLGIGGPASAVPLPPPRPIRPATPTIPLPPERPEEEGPPMPPAPEARTAPTASPLPVKPSDGAPVSRLPPPAEPDLACAGLLSGGAVVATALPPIADAGDCGIASPVRVEAIVLRDGRRVPLLPAATMRCDLAANLADWLRDDVVPATAAEGDLVAVEDAAAYACRSRNRLPGERLSEHARGNAIDILGLRFAHLTLGIADAGARPVWARLRPSACLRFATVLGPGSDAYHTDDLHLDLEHRRSGAHLCQWDVP